MHLTNELGILNQSAVMTSTAHHHLYPRVMEDNPLGRDGVIIALSTISGALLFGFICMTVSMCNWRIKYLSIKKQLDAREYGMKGSPLRQKPQVGGTPTKVAQVETPVKMPVKTPAPTPETTLVPVPARPPSLENSPPATPARTPSMADLPPAIPPRSRISPIPTRPPMSPIPTTADPLLITPETPKLRQIRVVRKPVPGAEEPMASGAL